MIGAVTLKPSINETYCQCQVSAKRTPFRGDIFQLISLHKNILGGAVASWLVCLSPDRAVRVRALAGDIVLCSWASHFTPTVPLSIQVYKWVPANLKLRVTLRWTSIPSRGSRNTPSSFMLQKPG